MTASDPTLDMHAFLVTRWEGEPVNAAPEEHDDLRWFRPKDLAGLTMAHPGGLSSILGAVRVDGPTSGADSIVTTTGPAVVRPFRRTPSPRMPARTGTHWAPERG
jgi:hypothetical protein